MACLRGYLQKGCKNRRGHCDGKPLALQKRKGAEEKVVFDAEGEGKIPHEGAETEIDGGVPRNVAQVSIVNTCHDRDEKQQDGKKIGKLGIRCRDHVAAGSDRFNST